MALIDHANAAIGQLTASPHPFQQAGLGRAPFKCVAVNDGGSHCAFCGTAIRYEHVIRAAGGEIFIVGSDCVKKTDPVLWGQIRELTKPLVQHPLSGYAAMLGDPKVAALERRVHDLEDQMRNLIHKNTILRRDLEINNSINSFRTKLEVVTRRG